MAMTECHECEQPISDKATVCPHCGAKPKMNIFGKGSLARSVLIGGMLFWGMVFAGGFYHDQKLKRWEGMTREQRIVEQKKLAEEQKQRVEQEKPTEAELATWVVLECRRSIEKSLRDPASVKYDNAEYTTPVYKDKKDGSIAAVIAFRAKNGFGGMTRSAYMCRVKEESEDNWTVLKLTKVAQ